MNRFNIFLLIASMFLSLNLEASQSASSSPTPSPQVWANQGGSISPTVGGGRITYRKFHNSRTGNDGAQSKLP